MITPFLVLNQPPNCLGGKGVDWGGAAQVILLGGTRVIRVDLVFEVDGLGCVKSTWTPEHQQNIDQCSSCLKLIDQNHLWPPGGG